MSPSRRSDLRNYQQRAVASASKISEISMKSGMDSTASEFLAAKIEQFENEISYIMAIKEGLEEASVKGVLADTD